MPKKTTTSAGAGTGSQPRRVAKNPADSTGSACDLSELGLMDRFTEGRSQYEREIDQLIADTHASANPASVGRKYTDPRAINSLKKRADKKGIKLQFLTLPNGGGFVVRIDPDPKEKAVRKPPAAPPQPEPQPAGTAA